MKKNSIFNMLALSLVYFLLFSAIPARAQDEGHPTGFVFDQNNDPIVGVVVSNEDGVSTTTASDGSFSLPMKKGNCLSFSHIYYLDKKVNVGNKTAQNNNIVIHLSEKRDVDDNVIVNPYKDPINKTSVLGAISTVDGKEMEKYLAPSVLGSLQGRAAGFNVLQYRGYVLHYSSSNSQSAIIGSIPSSFGSGTYGDNSQFNYSLQGNEPVVIVDGVERELYDIDPETIQSVTLVKDALSSMFLGMRSSRGALIITTKNPTSGAFHISLTAKMGFHSPVNHLKPLFASQYSYLLNEALGNDGKSSLYSSSDYQAYLNHTDPYIHPDVNWEDELLNDNALSQSYNLNASGGGKVAQYFISLGYMNEQGPFKSDNSLNSYNTNLNYNRYMISSKINIRVTKDFTATLYALGRVREGNQPGGTGSGYSDILNAIYTTPSNAYPIKNPNGSWGGNSSFANNLMSQVLSSGYISDNARDIMASMKLKYDFNSIVKGLSAQFNGAIAALTRTAIIRTKQNPVYALSYDGDNAVYAMFGTSSAQINNFNDVTSYQYLYGKLSIDYNRMLGKHTFGASVAGNVRQEIDDYDLPKLPADVQENFSYDYAKKYFLQAAMSESYYNRYNNNSRWGDFYAAGLGWDISQENFLKNIPWINLLKLRATIGKTGSGVDNSGYYTYRQSFQDVSTAAYLLGTSLSNGYFTEENTPLANPYITWEKAHKMDIGLDASFFNNRLRLTFDYYNDKYYDLLQTRGKSIEIIGASYPLENIGRTRRQGLELTLEWQYHIQDFNYYLSGNWTTEYSKLLFMDEQEGAYPYMRQTGHATTSIMGLVADGFLTAKDIQNNYPVMTGFNNIQPGDVKYKDLNGDGVINEYDRTIIGGDKPLGYFGIEGGLEWKGMEFSMLWQGVYNRDIYLSDRTLTEGFQRINQSYGQAYENLLNRWTPETASTATYPRLTAGGNDYDQGNGWNSSLWIRKGNFIRLKNISIAYNLPESFCHNYLGGIRVKLFLNGQNLLTFSACDLIDPEVTFTSSSLQKTIFAGVKVNF